MTMGTALELLAAPRRRFLLPDSRSVRGRELDGQLHGDPGRAAGRPHGEGRRTRGPPGEVEELDEGVAEPVRGRTDGRDLAPDLHTEGGVPVPLETADLAQKLRDVDRLPTFGRGPRGSAVPDVGVLHDLADLLHHLLDRSLQDFELLPDLAEVGGGVLTQGEQEVVGPEQRRVEVSPEGVAEHGAGLVRILPCRSNLAGQPMTLEHEPGDGGEGGQPLEAGRGRLVSAELHGEPGLGLLGRPRPVDRESVPAGVALAGRVPVGSVPRFARVRAAAGGLDPAGTAAAQLPGPQGQLAAARELGPREPVEHGRERSHEGVVVRAGGGPGALPGGGVVHGDVFYGGIGEALRSGAGSSVAVPSAGKQCTGAAPL
jgi:hypothetical protein